MITTEGEWIEKRRKPSAKLWSPPVFAGLTRSSQKRKPSSHITGKPEELMSANQGRRCFKTKGMPTDVKH